MDATGCIPVERRGGAAVRSQVAPETERLVQSVAISAGTWGAVGSPATWRERGRSAWRPVQCSESCARVGLATRRRGWRCSNSRRSTRWGVRRADSPPPLARSSRSDSACRGSQARRARTVWTPSTSASSKGWARSGRSPPATPSLVRGGVAAARLHRDAHRHLPATVAPALPPAGWPLQRVLTDGGSEFKGAFDEACRDLGIRHTRTKPRHAWTNGFVERLQGTILQEHWRVTFRRGSSPAGGAPTLAGRLLHFYNYDRHQGYRLAAAPHALLGTSHRGVQRANAAPWWGRRRSGGRHLG